MITENLCMVTVGGTYVVHVEDVAAAVYECIESGQPCRQLLGRDFLEFRELATIARAHGDRQGPLWVMPKVLVTMGLWLNKMGIRLVNHPDAAIAYAQMFWEPQLKESEELLGKQVDFRSAQEAIREVVDWLLIKKS